MFKDECEGTQTTKFVGLRAKLYAYKKEDDKEETKCKGLKKSVKNKTLSVEHYEKCLFSNTEIMRPMNVIRNRKHKLFSETVNKIALSCDDNKRIILEDKINTLAYGHYKAKELEDIE